MRTAALLVLAAVSPIGAQEGEGDRAPPLLTLQAAMERAVEFSPEYRRALGELELLSHPRQRWWADFIPAPQPHLRNRLRRGSAHLLAGF